MAGEKEKRKTKFTIGFNTLMREWMMRFQGAFSIQLSLSLSFSFILSFLGKVKNFAIRDQDSALFDDI